MKDMLNPIAKIDESGSIIEKYIYGLRSNVPEYVIRDNDKYKIISNHLGSPIRVVDSSQDVVKSIKYDTFGNIIEENGAFELPFRFAGGIYDEDTKLVRFGVRDYEPEVGRWTAKEPLGFSGARNFYVYAGNDGVNRYDLDGLIDIVIFEPVFWEEVGQQVMVVADQALEIIGVASATVSNLTIRGMLYPTELGKGSDYVPCSPLKKKDPCHGKIKPEDIYDESTRDKDAEDSSHEEHRKTGGYPRAFEDLFYLTGIVHFNPNKSVTGKACDGSYINYHRAHNEKTKKMPTIQIIKNGKTKIKIRYPWR